MASIWATLRRPVLAVAGVASMCGLWEAYKAIDGTVLGWHMPARSDDSSMPHVWTILGRLNDPENRGTESHSVARAVFDASWHTLRLAGAALLVGTVVGLALAVFMQRFKVAERALVPYVVISQTIPLIALATVVVTWGSRLVLFGMHWKSWMSVALIAGYLAFCPIAVGALRGLQSPGEASVELMDSMAAGRWATLTKLRFPAAVPYLIPAFRLAAASAVVGAIVAEISIGKSGGIGRLILEYSREATSDPAKVYTAMLGAAALGLLVAGAVQVVDRFAMRHRPVGLRS
jgi:NitT/TauT family transport system permease protein